MKKTLVTLVMVIAYWVLALGCAMRSETSETEPLGEADEELVIGVAPCKFFPAICDDGNPCTTDLCSDQGCVHGAISGCSVAARGSDAQKSMATIDPDFIQPCKVIPGLCDDGNPCTTDLCTDQGCAYGATSSGSCVTDTGYPGLCVSGHCAKACADACACEDNNPCTSDTCISGACINLALDGSDCGGYVAGGQCHGTWCCTSEYTCFTVYEPTVCA